MNNSDTPTKYENLYIFDFDENGKQYFNEGKQAALCAIQKNGMTTLGIFHDEDTLNARIRIMKAAFPDIHIADCRKNTTQL